MNHLPPITVAVTLFSGFLQRLGTAGGLVEIEHAVHQVCRGRADVRVRLHPWNTNVSDAAEAVWRFRPGDRRQVHLVAGYSYGGQAAVNFCRELWERGGATVSELWLCDAVRRWRWAPGLAAGLGLGKLVVPPSVDRVVWFRQQNPRWLLGRGATRVFEPAGHDVEAESPLATIVEPPIVRGVRHVYMDDDNDFRAGFMGTVARFVNTIEEC